MNKIKKIDMCTLICGCLCKNNYEYISLFIKCNPCRYFMCTPRNFHKTSRNMAGFTPHVVANLSSISRNDLAHSDSATLTNTKLHMYAASATSASASTPTTSAPISNAPTDVSKGLKNVVGWLKQVILLYGSL